MNLHESGAHAAFPQLCESCRQRFLADVVTNRRAVAAHGLCWCPHHQTLALATTRDGRVVQWMLDAPVTEEHVAAQIERLQKGRLSAWNSVSEQKH